MNNNNKIDWFSIDMDAMQAEYDAYLAAEQELQEVISLAALCGKGLCDHDRKRNKDGSADKRSTCPQMWGLYDRECSLGNNLYYTHHKALWEAIGLGVNADA